MKKIINNDLILFKPAQNFYWYFDKNYYFEAGKQYQISEDLYNQVKHYETKQKEINNC